MTKKILRILTFMFVFAASFGAISKEMPADTNAAIPYWKADSPTLAAVTEYVSALTDPASPSYVEPCDRIVVFDSDGTLYGELFPTYFDQCLMLHRYLHDPTFEPAPEDKEFCESMEAALLKHEPEPDSPRSTAQMAAESFKGFTIDEFRAYIRDFMQTEAAGFEGMTYAEGYYKPMVALIEYLSENDFQIFVVSGTENTILRELAAGTIDEWIPSDRIIGSTFSLEATGQGDTDGRKYTYAADDDVLLEGNLTFKTQKMNKVVTIVNNIGKVPVLVFGNSSGDLAMGEYCVQHGGKAFMLLCDDTERDYGKPDVAEEFREDCEKRGFGTVSMRDEFETIYGEDVVRSDKKKAPALKPVTRPASDDDDAVSSGMKKGTALKEGDCIGIAAPAYYVKDNDFNQTVMFLRQLGYRVKVAEAAVGPKYHFFAGEDQARAESLNQLFADDDVDAIMCLRGGYGSARILDYLDFEMIAEHPKPLIGYSDITALHVALNEKCGISTIHGPMVSSFKDIYSQYISMLFSKGMDLDELVRDDLTFDKNYLEKKSGEFKEMPLAYTVKQFVSGISLDEPIGEIELPEGTELKTLVPGTAEGQIIGGNLTVLTSLVGTEYELQGDHAILFFEEVGESAYRVDRMLRQLYESGLFDRVDGILIGEMTNMTDQADCSVAEVLKEYADLAGKPCISGVPAGHGDDNMFLPFGVQARMTANENGSASLEILEAALEAPEEDKAVGMAA